MSKSKYKSICDLTSKMLKIWKHQSHCMKNKFVKWKKWGKTHKNDKFII